MTTRFARRGRKLLYWFFVLGLLAAIIAVGVADPFFLQSIRLFTFDSFQRLAPRSDDGNQPVRVIDIDDRSLAILGQWPWPRTVMATLLEKAGAAGAVAIATDIMFPEPDRTSLVRYTRDLPPDKADQVARLIGGPLDNDAAFAAAIAALPVVLSIALVNDGNPAAPVRKYGMAVAGDDPRPFLHGFAGALNNLPALDAAASGIGANNWIPDKDGIVRRVPLIFRAGDHYVPSLAAEALRVAQGAGTYVLKSSNASGETGFGAKTGLNHVKIGAVEAPTDADGAIWLHFRHDDGASHVPAWTVMAGQVGNALNGRIVLIGSSAPGLKDTVSTPLDQAIPGVEIHLQMLEQLLAGTRLIRPDFAAPLELVVTLIAALLVAAILPRVSAIWSSALAALIIAALFAFGWYGFVRRSLLFDPTAPAIAIFLVTAACTAWVYRRTQNQRGEIRRAFGQYLSPEVVRQLIQNPELLALGGEERALTIMFCDVRNFTAIAEALDARSLTRFINTLLTALTGAILDRRGTIDKYMGDAIMAFWNAPLPDSRHAGDAAAAAIAMAKAMDHLNATWKAEGRAHQDVRIGIGLNTGIACVGNLGSDQRFDYSCLGDEVNVASRLQGLTSQYGVTVAIGEGTAKALADTPVLELDLVRVRGRVAPLRLFTLAETLDIPLGRMGAQLAVHAAFIAHYRAREWDEAEMRLNEARAIGTPGLDTLYRIYEQRIAGYRAASPAPDWDGADSAAEK